MIRAITIEEVEQFAQLGRWFFLSVEAEDDFSSEGFISTWKMLIEREAGFIIGRFDDTGKPVEAIGAALYRDGQATGLVARTMFWYYQEAPKGLEAGILYRALETECKAREVKTLWVGAKCNDRLTRVGGFLMNSGFRLDEMLYRKNL